MKNTNKAAFAALLLAVAACASPKSVASSAARDGSSFERAIIAGSVAEEYRYVRSVCPTCKFTKQSLVVEKKKPHDVLTFQTVDGQEVRYYFDVSKFYGKGF